MKHTSGTWKVTNDGLHIYSEKTEQDIASCPITSTRTPCREEAEANARLIAAAPALLEACKAAHNAATIKLGTYSETEKAHNEIIWKLKEAIAAAETT